MASKKLQNTFAELEEHVILAPYTSFRVGGRARYFLVVKEREVLIEALRICREERIPWFILGGGTNILISSLGFPGLVIKNEMNHLEVLGDCIRAESGVVLATVLKTAKEHGLMGLARLHGVPGTFGGAVRGNAGVPGCEMGSFVVQATILDEDLHIKTVDHAFFDYAYRYSRLKETKEILLDATIRLTPGGEPEAIGVEMLEMLKSRKAKQPWGASGGSYFKNHPNYAAGFLIDQVQGKGMKYGDAMISEKHGNFFLNTGSASSRDIQYLAEQVRRKVLYEYGILLEEEVEFVGRKPWSTYVMDHPFVKWCVVTGLIVAGIVGVLVPVFPGVIFWIVAVYIVSPKTSEYVALILIKLRRLAGFEVKRKD